MKNFLPVTAILSAFLVSACTSEPSEDLQDSIVEATAVSNFDPANSVIPFPNDLLFSGSLDGTLNIPVANPANFSDPQVALNALDGFSTVAPITTGFTGPINAGSINGDSVKMYQVTLSPTPAPNDQGGAVVAINQQLVFGVDYVATVSSVDSSGSTLAISPLTPLDQASSYYVVITNQLQSSDGNQMGASGAYIFAKTANPLEVGGVSQFPSLTDAQAVALEPLRMLVNTSETTLLGFDTSLAFGDIIMSWSFTTQSIGPVLNTVRTFAGATTATLAASTQTVGPFGPGRSPAGAANIWEGTLNSVRYYLTPVAGDPTVILNNPWQAQNVFAGETNLTGANPLPALVAPLNIPLIVTTPFDTVTFPAPWRTVIYQHGITRKRSDILAITDSLAAAGFAVVAIDLPLHGEAPGTLFYQGGSERTFDVDLVGQDASGSIISAGPDGTVDSSGAHYINLTNLLMSRDNIRQSIADLFALTASIPFMNVDGLGGPDLATGAAAGEIYLLAHSLGAIVATPFHALEPNVLDAVMVNGGGGIPKILDGSASFSGAVVSGLAANGVSKGTADYESFLGAAQTVVDDADPLNYAALQVAKGEGILHMIVVGGNSSPSDLTVPNRVPDGNDSSGTVPAPLAGSEPLISLLGLTAANSDQMAANGLFATRFLAGTHSSFIDPSVDLAVTTEMQTQMATFLASSGGFLDVTDPSLLQAP